MRFPSDRRSGPVPSQLIPALEKVVSGVSAWLRRSTPRDAVPIIHAGRSPHIRARASVTLTVNDASATVRRRCRVVAHFRNVERLGNDLSLATIARSVQQLEGALQVEIDSERHVRIRVDLPLGSDS